MLVVENRAASSLELAYTFAGLMDLYERNYIGLRRLIPAWPAAGTELTSVMPNSLALHLTVTERFRYTTDLILTYEFKRHSEQGRRLKREPNLHVRVYHDARQAEVTAAEHRHWPMFDAEYCTGLEARWRANRFLWKWLNYCLHQGHRFSAQEEQRLTAAAD